MVLVVQEIFGVHEHIQDICRRFAKLGYLDRPKCLHVLAMFQLSNIQEIRKVV